MTNQTIDGVLVSRELLERILSYQWFPSGGVVTFDHRRIDRERLSALLEVERCTSCDGSGDLIDLTGEWRGYCVCPAGVALKNKPAAQPQGEPAAWIDAAGTLYPSIASVEAYLPHGRSVRPLYAEQPALDRPVHANPPPGTEPSGTHPHNDGLDEMRKP